MIPLPKTQLLEAIRNCLFSDARASEEEIELRKDWDRSKRGYWGEQLDGKPWGSKLWLLGRYPKNQETLNHAEAYTYDALKWLLTDEGISDLGVHATWQSEDLLLKVHIAGQRYDFVYDR